MDEKTAERALTAAFDAVIAARENATAVVKECYPVGSYVRWKIGSAVLSGTVVQHSYLTDLFVQDAHGKRRRITVYAILEALKDETD